MVPDRKFNDTFSDYAKMKKATPKKVKPSCERCAHAGLSKHDPSSLCARCKHNIIFGDFFSLKTKY